MNPTSHLPGGGAARLRAAASAARNSAVNQNQGQPSSSVASGIHYSVGSPAGEAGKIIRLEDSQKRVTELYARVIDPSDIGVGDIDNKLKKIAFQRGSEDGCEYVPLKLDVVEGGQTKKQVLLVRVDHIREQMGQFVKTQDVRKNSTLTPTSIFEFLEEHCAEDDEVDAAVSALHQGQGSDRKRMAGDLAEGASSSGAVVNRQSVFEELADVAVCFTVKALHLDTQQTAAIGFIAQNYKRSKEYLEFVEKQKGKPEKDQIYAYHIRAGSNVTIDGQVYKSPLSLLVNPAAPEGVVDVEVLLKGKVPNYSLRARGSFKSVKTTLDISTGRIRVQCTFDVGAQAKSQLGFRDESGALLEERLLSPEQLASLRASEQELIRGYMKEAELQNKFSGLEMGKPGTYEAKTTRPSKEQVRISERKLIRKGGELVFTYTMEEAQGDLADPTVRGKVVGTTNVLGISPSFYNCLLSTAQTMQKLHQNNWVHRDLKMDNLLLFTEKGEDNVKISDYGLCIEVNPDGTMKNNESIAGTYNSFDPQFYVTRARLNAARGGVFGGVENMMIMNNANTLRKRLDCKSGDVYGLGCTYYALLMAKKDSFDNTAWTPFAIAGCEVIRLIRQCENKRKNKTWTSSDGEAVANGLSELLNPEKTLQLWEETRNNLMKVCPLEVATFIANMLHPDPKSRPNVEQVVATIQTFQALVR